ncbi:hypothetical protein E4K66_29850 [Bradyrhizobium frederickii]|uniref:Uncharacterized protein n=1 Tax=Bradyrhizobium frederickii TaxID=2560054 RepID=A0A4Y9KU13_9BRAD|nr:hypothetical protein [Bradyrhizobium frederickii]TFV34830.1 hypothetical protein E4K66_29850 [Bradyrhizobium frederickii]
MTAPSKPNEVFTQVGPVERLAIEAISPPRRSLRKHTDRHKKQYAKCIEALGLITPVVIDSAGVIALADTFKELSQLDLGFSLEVTGFSQGESGRLSRNGASIFRRRKCLSGYGKLFSRKAV